MIYPPLCFGCRVAVDANNTLCNKCWGKLSIIANPMCKHCGIPFPVEMEGLCQYCRERKPKYKAARAALRYDDFCEDLIHKYKYYDKTELVPIFANFISKAGEEIIPICEVIIPVPMDSKKLRQRKYNQAALLAKKLADIYGKKYIPDYLLKTKSIPSQSGLTRENRFKNVKGIFAFNLKYRREIYDRVLLIDDVYTTGATVIECTKQLKKHGVSEVFILTIAKSF
ncbi:MAG: ComF family protein [Rickettsiales bacterium]